GHAADHLQHLSMKNMWVVKRAEMTQISGNRVQSCLLILLEVLARAELYTLSLHDALPICRFAPGGRSEVPADSGRVGKRPPLGPDRKSTRLNSSHQIMSYAVFCLKKKIIISL